MSVLSPFTTRVKTNLDGVLQMTQMINGIMMTGDSRANQIIVELYDNNGRVRLDPIDPQNPTTSIVGYFIRSDGYTVEVTGTVNENGEAVVIIPKAAYLVTGALSIAIRLLGDKYSEIVEGHEVILWGTKIVIAALSCFVQNTETDAIIDPDHRIPDVQELLAFIDHLSEQYDLYAEAEGIRVLNEQGRVTAETARNTNFQTLYGKIDNMTVSAEALRYDATPTVQITEVNGHKHITFGMVSGEPFAIKRTFASVQEMMNYTGTDVQTGDMVIIVSTVEDPDNAKLYLKTANSWAFIVDMSGATGIQGPKGNTGDTGNGIGSAVLNANYTLTLVFTDGTSYTTPSIRGETGNGIAGTVLNADHTLTITFTDGTSYTTPSIQGDKGDTGNTGDTGNGIASTVLNADHTLTITFTDGTSYTTPSIQGDKGDTGDDVTFDHAVVQYQISDSSTTVPSTWVDNIPTIPQGYFLWTRTTIYFDPSGSTSFYSIARQGIDGGGGTVRSVNSVSPDANGNVNLVRVSGTRLIIG